MVFMVWLSCAAAVLSTVTTTPSSNPGSIDPAIFTAIVAALGSIGAIGVGLLTAYASRRSGLIELKKELEPVREERQEIKERLKEGSKEDIISTIQLGLNQLTEYYVINKSQARNSFRSSMTLIIIGFLTLIFGIWFSLFGKSPNIILAVISGISGILLQFLGGSSFYVYRTSLEQLNYFFNQLIRTQDTMLAIQLTKELTDQEKQVDIMEKLIMNLIDRSANATVDFASTKKRSKVTDSNVKMNGHVTSDSDDVSSKTHKQKTKDTLNSGE